MKLEPIRFMPPEENQNTGEIIIGENSADTDVVTDEPVSAEPKLEVVEPVAVVDEIQPAPSVPLEPLVAEVAESGQGKNLEVEKPTEQVEISEPEIVEEVVSPTGETTENENAGLPHSSATAPELAKTKVEETGSLRSAVPEADMNTREDEPIEEILKNEEVEQPQQQEQKIENQPVVPIPKVANEPIQNQEILTKPEIQIVEKIVYQIPPRDTSNEVNGQANLIQNLLNKARAKIQERKRKKLDKIMALFETQPEISNSKIQDLFRTTKRSATRYLNILEKEQKITQIGITGRGVKYIKKQ